MQRRSVLVGFLVVLLAGCSAVPGFGPQEITPEEPNDDGTATLGEITYLLEENDVEEFERLDVTSMTRDGDVVQLTYASNASHTGEFVDELSTIAALYAIYVDNGGDTDRIVVTVEPNFDGQAERFHVTTEWARQYNDDALTGTELVNKILGTASYPSSGNESA